MNTNSSLYGVEKKKPKRVLKHFPYEKAYVDSPDGDRYVLNDLFMNPEETALFEPLWQSLVKLIQVDNPRFRRDNKEVYLYENEDGEVISVLFKDNRAHFGREKDIRIL